MSNISIVIACVVFLLCLVVPVTAIESPAAELLFSITQQPWPICDSIPILHPSSPLCSAPDGPSAQLWVQCRSLGKPNTRVPIRVEIDAEANGQPQTYVLELLATDYWGTRIIKLRGASKVIEFKLKRLIIIYPDQSRKIVDDPAYGVFY